MAVHHLPDDALAWLTEKHTMVLVDPVLRLVSIEACQAAAKGAGAPASGRSDFVILMPSCAEHFLVDGSSRLVPSAVANGTLRLDSFD